MVFMGNGWNLKRAIGVLVGTVLLAGAVGARADMQVTPKIEVSFEDGATPREQIIHVEADFGAVGAIACDILCCFQRYSSLHPWIVESTLEEVDEDGVRVVYFVLDLPWPMGRQWSRLEVERFGDRTMAWMQTEGSFRKNHGTVVLHPGGEQTHLSYWAVIDVGVPNVLARPFQEQFVREFLRAVHEVAATGQ